MSLYLLSTEGISCCLWFFSAQMTEFELRMKGKLYLVYRFIF